MACIGNWLKAEKRQSQPVRPVRAHFFEALEPRLLLSADLTEAISLSPLAASPVDHAVAVVVDQSPGSSGPAASGAVVDTSSLEVSPLATTISWDGGGDGTSWHDPLNWSGNVVPGATDDAVINLPGSNPVIRYTAASGTRTVKSVNCGEAFELSGGSLTISGGAGQFTGSSSLIGGSLTAAAGARVTFQGATSLRDVNLYASGGGQLLFPKATSYTDNGYGQTIQASGANSRIELPGLTTFNGGDTTSTQVAALTGGTVVLAGNLLPGATLNASGAGAVINLVRASGVTTQTLTDVNLYASGGGRILGPSVTSYVDTGYGQTIQASGTGSRIELPGLATLDGGDTTDTQVGALTSGTVVLAGNISGRATLTASGGVLDVSRVKALTNSSTTNITINASNGSTVTLPAAVTTLTDVNLYASSGGRIQGPSVKYYTDNGYGQTIQASGAGSRIELPGLTTLDGGGTTSTQVAALTGGTVVLAGNIVPGVTLNASGAGAVISLVRVSGVTTQTLTDVNLYASGGGKILGPSVTSYVDTGYGQTIQASGASSRIELPSLATLDGGDTTDTQVGALTSGTVMLAGNISGRATLTASGGVLDLSRVKALTNSSTTNITINASSSSTVTLPATVTTLTDVNLYASSGGKILCPSVKSYVDNGYGQTIQASGTGSQINLGSLVTFNGGDTTSTQVAALTGGTVVLAGNILPGATLNASGAGAVISLVRVSGVTTQTLTDVNLYASGGGKILGPSVTSYVDTGYGQTIQASGTGSRIELPGLATLDGGDTTDTQIAALTGGTVVLARTISGRATLTASGGVLDLSRVTALTNSTTTNITINASNGSTVTLPAAVTTLTDVNLYASGGGKIQGSSVKSYLDTGYGQTIQASGTGSQINLGGLVTFNGGDTTSTQVAAQTGGTVVLAGNILPGATLTASGTGAVINLVRASGVATQTLTDVNLYASGGGKILGSSVTSYVDTGYGQTIQASGTGSRIELPGLTTFDGGDTTATQIRAVDGGIIVLGGQTFSGLVTYTESGGGDIIPAAWIKATDASAGEPTNGGTYRIGRPGPTTTALTVYFTVSGTATRGSDYQLKKGTTVLTGNTVVIDAGKSYVDVTLAVLNDTTPEATETAIVTLATGTGYVVAPAPVNTATVSILDDEPPVVSITAPDASAGEPSNNGTYRISRIGSIAAALTVNFAVTGTATRGSDYQLKKGTTVLTGNTVVIDAAKSYVDVTLAILDDAAAEATETAIVTLAAGTGYTVGSPNKATVSILDNEVSALTAVPMAA